MPEDIAGEPEVQPTPEPEQPQPEAPTREEFEQLARAYMDTNNRLMQAAAYIEALQSAHPEQEDEEEYDEDEGLTPDALQRLVAETVATTLQAQLEQHPAINQVTEQRGAQIANMQLDQIEKQIGKFDRGLAMSLAQAAHSRGYPPEQAVYAGAQEAKRIADQERQAAISEYEQQLKNRLEVPTEPGTRGSATPGQRQAKSYDEVNDNFFARRRAQQALN